MSLCVCEEGLSLMSVPSGVVRLGDMDRAPRDGIRGGGALSDAVGGVLLRIPFWMAMAEEGLMRE